MRLGDVFCKIQQKKQEFLAFFRLRAHRIKKYSLSLQYQTNKDMPSREVQTMIPKIRSFLKGQPIERAYLFGSCSRGEETKDSDVDLMVDLDASAHIGLFKYIRIKLELEDLLQRPVDLVESHCLLDTAQETANRDKILIYEREK